MDGRQENLLTTFVMLRHSMPILDVNCVVFVLGILVNAAGLCLRHAEPSSSATIPEADVYLYRGTLVEIEAGQELRLLQLLS